MDHDGNIWTSGRPLKKFDVETKKCTFLSPDVPDTYGITVDQKGMIWATELNSRDNQDLVMVDPRTKKVTHYKTPDAVSYRRVQVDSKGNDLDSGLFRRQRVAIRSQHQNVQGLQAAGTHAHAVRICRRSQ